MENADITEFKKKNDTVTINSQQNISNKIHKSHTPNHKSPKTVQSNKISTWLSKTDVKIENKSCSSTCNSYNKELKKNKEIKHEMEYSKYKSEEKVKNSLLSKQDSKKKRHKLKKSIEFRDEKRQVTSLHPIPIQQEEKNGRDSLEDAIQTKTQSMESCSTHRLAERITENDESHKNDSPLGSLKTFAQSSSTEETVTKSVDILTSRSLNKWLIKKEKKKSKDIKENQCSLKENHDNLKRKKLKAKFRENIDVYSKRQKLDMDNINMPIKVKKNKKAVTLGSQKEEESSLTSKSVNELFHENVVEKFENIEMESHKLRESLNITPPKNKSKDDSVLRRSPRTFTNHLTHLPSSTSVAKKLFTKHKSSPDDMINKARIKHDKIKNDKSKSSLKESDNKSRILKEDRHKSKAQEKTEKQKLNRGSSMKKTEPICENKQNKEKKYRKKYDNNKDDCTNRVKLKKIKQENSLKNKTETKRNSLKHKKQEKIDSFLKKKSKDDNVSKKSKFSRSNSSESCDFPSFKKTNKKPKTSKNTETFKKYGVTLPSIEEILKEQKDLERYKDQMEAFQNIELDSFDLPFSVKDLKRNDSSSIAILGCEHLTIDEITEAFNNNLTYISDIFHGNKFNERHKRFFDNKNKTFTLTTKDLTYSTSMVVFNDDQKEHMVKLLKDEFDPKDEWTPYFFQVLLPELCLKIFMDVHEMSYEEAVTYLDVRPITN